MYICVHARVCVLSCDCNPTDSPIHGIFRNTGVGCQFLLQGIFLTPGSSPCLLRLLHWQTDSSPLCNLGSPPSLLQLANCQHGVRSSEESHIESEIKASVSQIHNFLSYLLVLSTVEDFIHLYNNAHSCKESLFKNVHM